MAKIFIDSDYKCHTANPDGAYAEYDISSFDGKCTEFIEGFRFVPAGHTWTRDDGETFEGEMIAPWKPWNELDEAQREYERLEAEDMREALALLGVTLDG